MLAAMVQWSDQVQPAERPRARLLLVDDEAVITFALQTYFEANGFDVHAAAECEEALALLANNEYDVIIADLRLTGTNAEEGLEVIRFARERNSWAGIVLLTAYGTADVSARAKQRGVDVVLQKPKPLVEVAAAVRSLLEARSM